MISRILCSKSQSEREPEPNLELSAAETPLSQATTPRVLYEECGFGKLLSSSERSVSGARLIHTSIVFRHGARGPGKSELQKFDNSECPVVKQWMESEMEDITTLGMHQMFELGQWFVTGFLMHADRVGKLQRNFSPASPTAKMPVLWRSSNVKRVIESGESFIKGMQDCECPGEKTEEWDIALSKMEISSEPHPFEDVTPEEVFRAWNGKEHKKKFKDFQGGDIWKSKAEEHSEFVVRIHEKLEAHVGNKDPAKLLGNMPYFHCLLEVEHFWNRNDSTNDSDERDERTVKDKLISLLTTEEVERVQELARWVWETRFFALGWGPHNGGRLLEELVNCATNEIEWPIAMWSCHDYTLLSFIAALGFKKYDFPLLGFGAFIILEVWELPDKSREVEIVLDTNPFSPENNASHLAGKRMRPLFLRKPIAELEKVVEENAIEAAKLMECSKGLDRASKTEDGEPGNGVSVNRDYRFQSMGSSFT